MVHDKDLTKSMLDLTEISLDLEKSQKNKSGMGQLRSFLQTEEPLVNSISLSLDLLHPLSTDPLLGSNQFWFEWIQVKQVY